MTQPGRAAIEIVGDASKLGSQLERDAQRAIDNVDIDTDNISKQISDGFGEGVDDAIAKLSELNPAVVVSSRNLSNRFQEAMEEVVDAVGASVPEIQDHLEQITESAQGAAESIPLNFNETLPEMRSYFDLVAKLAEKSADSVALVFEEGGARIRRTFRDSREETEGLFDGIDDDSRRASDNLRSKFLRPVTAGFSKLGEIISSAGSALADLAGGIDLGSLLQIGLKIAAFIAAIPVIIGLAAALADLVGFVTLLPAAIGGAAASIIVLTVAFNGFGDAIGAILEGDPEKITEALKKLAPAARQVAREFERVLPLFRQVGDSIQQEFFEPLVGQMDRFGRQVLPRLRNELDTLAQSMGRAFGHFGDLINESQNISILERLLASTARITDQLGAAFANLGQAFLNAIGAGLPSLETLSTRLAEAVSSFAAFINASIESGAFQAFLDDAIATLDELLDLGAAVGELLTVLFGGTDDAGRGFIATLTDVTQRMTLFFKSAEGQRVLERMAETIGLAGRAVGFLINAFLFLADAGNDVEDAFTAVVDFFNRAGSDIARFWSGLVETVSSAVDSVVGFFSALPEQISAFVDSIPGRVAMAFQALADAALTALAFLIAGVIVFFTDLPGQIVGSLVALAGLLATTWDNIVLAVTTAFTNAREFVVTTWENILTFFSGLGPRASTFFQQMVDAVIARVTSLIEYVQGLPGRILAALGNLGAILYDAGARILQGLIDGISSRIGALRDRIASAVQTIRDHLPFSPAKTGPLSGSGSPQIAGAVIAEMIAAGLDAGTPLITQAAGRAANATTSPFGAIGQAGVTPLVSPAGTAGSTSVLSPVEASTETQPVFIVQIGNEEIEAFIDKRVDERVQVEVRRLVAGTRGI